MPCGGTRTAAFEILHRRAPSSKSGSSLLRPLDVCLFGQPTTTDVELRLASCIFCEALQMTVERPRPSRFEC